MAEYYIGRDNKQFGPFPFEQLLANGLTPDTLVWCSGMPSWEKAKDVPELAGLFAPQQPQYQQYQPQYQPQYQQPAYQQPQYQQPQYQQPAYQHPQGNYNQQTAPQSTYLGWNIALTIVGVLCICFYNPASLILGIIGIVYSSGADVAKNQGDMATAQAKAKTAKLMAIIGFSIIVLFFIVGMFCGALAFILEEFKHTL